MLFFRDQHMTLAEQVEVGRRLGELHIHPAAKAPDGFPEVLVVHTDENSKYTAGNGWHTDVSCDERPPGLSMLRIEQVPSAGGDTVWASMYEAYETLSTSMQDYLLTLTAIHAGDKAYIGRYAKRGDDTDYPVSEHPVIRTHPISGRKALYVNSGFTVKIKQLTHRESDALLAFLYDHIAYGVRFQVPVPVGAPLGRHLGQSLRAASRQLGLLPRDPIGLPGHDPGRGSVPRGVSRVAATGTSRCRCRGRAANGQPPTAPPPTSADDRPTVR